MPYQFTPVGAPEHRCGYRIQHVEDAMRDTYGVHVKGPDWWAVLAPEDWASYAGIVDDGEFSVKMIALALELQLGTPVQVVEKPNASTGETG